MVAQKSNLKRLTCFLALLLILCFCVVLIFGVILLVGWTDECCRGPCVNGGTCTDRWRGFTCRCSFQFTGNTCSTKTGCTTEAPSRGAELASFEYRHSLFSMKPADNDSILIAARDRLLILDQKTGKMVWNYNPPFVPKDAVMLPNGPVFSIGYSKQDQQTYIFKKTQGERWDYCGSSSDYKAMALGLDDDIYVADRDCMVYVYNQDCTVKRTFDLKSAGANCHELSTLAATEKCGGRFVASDYVHNCLHIFSLDGVHINSVGRCLDISTPGGPYGVSFDQKGNILASYLEYGNAYTLNPDGEVLLNLRFPNAQPMHMFSREGQLVMYENMLSQVKVYRYAYP